MARGRRLRWERRRGGAAASLVLLVAFLHVWAHADAVQLVTGTPSLFTTIHSQHHTVVALHGPESSLSKPGRLTVAPGASARTMTDKDGKQFVCHLPAPAGQGGDDEQEEQGTAAALATAVPVPPSEVKTPFELLERMTALCLYRQEGLWTYEMCYKKHTRQFRQATGDTKGEDFSCGVYAGDEVQSEEIKMDSASPSDVRLRYVSHNMTGGAPCALTGSSRTSEVRFMCVKDVRDNVILSVREFPTCNYILTVSTPFLCKHPEFKPPDDQLRVIHCVPAATGAPHHRTHPKQRLSDQAATTTTTTTTSTASASTAATPEQAPPSASSAHASEGSGGADGAAAGAEPQLVLHDVALEKEEDEVEVEETEEDLGLGDSAAEGLRFRGQEQQVLQEEGEQEEEPPASLSSSGVPLPEGGSGFELDDGEADGEGDGNGTGEAIEGAWAAAAEAEAQEQGLEARQEAQQEAWQEQPQPEQPQDQAQQQQEHDEL